MSDDIIDLGWAVDTGDLERAIQRLEELRRQNGELERDGHRSGERLGQGMREGAGGIGAAGGALGALTLGLGAIPAVIGGISFAAATGSASEFAGALAEVSTLVDTSTFDMGGLADAARGLAAEYGQSSVSQVQGFYSAISAGASTAGAAMETMTAANKLAVGGVTDVQTSVDGLTSVMNAFGEEAGTAADVSDAMFVAMKAGKTTIGELAGNIGNVASIAAAAGASFEEILSATAALTKGGVGTSEAMNGLKAVLSAVIKPTVEAAEMADDLGLAFDVAAVQSKGLAGFLEDVAEKSGGSTDKLAVLFSGTEALLPVLALAGKSSGDFADILEAMGSKAGETQLALDKLAESPGFQWDRITAGAEAAFLGLGTGIVRNMVPALTFVADALGDLNEDIDTFKVRWEGLSFGQVLDELALMWAQGAQKNRESARQLLADLTESLVVGLDNLGTALGQRVSSLGTALGTYLGNLGTTLATGFTERLAFAGGALSTWFAELGSRIVAAGGPLLNVVGTVVELFNSAWTALGDAFPATFDYIGGFLGSVVEKIMEGGRLAIQAAADFGRGIIENIIDSIGSGAQWVVESVVSLIESIPIAGEYAGPRIRAALTDQGEGHGRSIADGLLASLPWIGEAAETLAHEPVELVQRESPAMAEAGTDLGDVLADALAASAAGVAQSAGAVASGATDELGKIEVPEEGVVESAAVAFATIESMAEKASREIESGLSSALQSADSFSDALENIGDFARSWLKRLIADFAAEQIMISVGMKDAGDASSMLGGLLGMNGGGGGKGGAEGVAGGAGAVGGAVGGLGSLASTIGSLVGPAMLAVGGLQMVSGWLSGNDQSLAESLRVLREVVPEVEKSLEAVRVSIGGQLTALGIDITDGFDQRVTGVFADAIADIDFGVSAENLADGVTHFTGRAYAMALEELSPELQRMVLDKMGLVGFSLDTVLTRAADLSEEQVERMGAAFAEFATIATEFVPMMQEAGANLGDSFDDAVLFSGVLIEKLGGMGPAVETLTFFLDNVVPAADRAAYELDAARTSVEAFNDGLNATTREMYGGADGIVNTREELHALWQAMHPASDAAAQVMQLAGSVVVLEDASEEAAEAQRQAAEAQRVALEAVTEATRMAVGQFDPAATGATSVANALIEMAGGLDAFQSANAAYYNAVYSAEEQQQIALANSAQAVLGLRGELDSLGIAMPTNLQQFRDLRGGLDLSTESGRALYTLLTDTAPAFAAVKDSGEGARAILEELPASLVGGLEPMPGYVHDTFAAMSEEALRAQSVLETSFGNVAEAADVAGADLVSLLDTALSDVLENSDAKGRSLVTLLDATFEEIVGNSGLAGTDLVANLDSAFDAVLASADVKGEDLVASLDGALGEVLENADVSGADLVAALQSAYGEAVENTQESGASLVASLDDALTAALGNTEVSGEELVGLLHNTFRTILDDSDLQGSALVETLDSALTTVIQNADLSSDSLVQTLDVALGTVLSNAETSGDDLVAAVNAAFDAVLAEAGIVREDLPPELREAFDAMVMDADSAARLLGDSSADGSGSVKDMAEDIGNSADALGRIADTLVGAFGNIGSAGDRAARQIDGAARTIGQIAVQAHSDRVAAQRHESAAREHIERYGGGYTSEISVQNRKKPTHSFSTGVDHVSHDGMLATLHQGEAVMKASVAEPLRQLGVYGTGIAPQSPLLQPPPVVPVAVGAEGQSVVELREIRAEMERALREQREQNRTLSRIAAEAAEQRRLLDRVERSNERIDRRIAA